MTAYAGAGIAPPDSDEEPTIKEIHGPGANAGARSNSGEGAAGQHAAAERTFAKDAAQHTNKGD
jgi:hypothetical protein